jgi:hypothetical protein
MSSRSVLCRMGSSKRRPYQGNEHERAQGIRQLLRTALREVRLGQHRGSIILLISSGAAKMTSSNLTFAVMKSLTPLSRTSLP